MYIYHKVKWPIKLHETSKSSLPIKTDDDDEKKAKKKKERYELGR